MNRAGWWIVVLLLLAAMGVAMVTSIRLENQTWDETVHLAAGYTYLKLGDFRLNWEHPPLGKMICALPLLAVNPRVPTEHASWWNGDTVTFGTLFLYRNRMDPDAMLFLARLPTIGLTLLLGLLIALWSRKYFGPAAAALAVFFYALDPNFIAHGRYVTTDLITALTMFLAVIAWARFLQTDSWVDLIGAGVALGLALASKFSMLFLFGLLPLLYVIRWWQQPRRYSIVHLIGVHAVLFSLGITTLLYCYYPDTKRHWIEEGKSLLPRYATQDNRTSRFLNWLGEKYNVPPHAYLLGINSLARHNAEGHPAYLLGKVSTHGRWEYFPVVFGVKTPTAVLLLLIITLVAAGRVLSRGRVLTRIRGAPFPWIVLIVPPAVYFLLAMSANLNLGWRHIMPIYPFLFVLVAAVLSRRPHWALLMLVFGLQVGEQVRIAPDYLAFFNTVSGGPENGARYVVDSNIDWGQDIKKLGVYKREHGIDQISIAYFGVTDLKYYLGKYRHLHWDWQGGDPSGLNTVVAISVTILSGAYGDYEKYTWFRDREPDAKMGHSIYVYDLRKDAGEAH